MKIPAERERGLIPLQASAPQRNGGDEEAGDGPCAVTLLYASG